MNPAILIRLKHSLQALAMPPEIQLSLLPDFVCKADELALDFDNWRSCIVTSTEFKLDAKQDKALRELDTRLDKMSGSENAILWTDEAIRRSPEWVEIRMLAQSALKAFGWPIEQPPSYGHEYVRGG